MIIILREELYFQYLIKDAIAIFLILSFVMYAFNEASNIANKNDFQNYLPWTLMYAFIIIPSDFS